MIKRFGLSLVLAASVFSGCSSLFGPSTPEQANSRQASLKLPAIVDKKSYGIEVVWEVPGEPVDGFVIRYGETMNELSKEVTILLSELREERDPEYGPVYRYLIKDVSGETPIFVSIAAFKGDAISDFSQAIKESGATTPQ